MPFHVVKIKKGFKVQDDKGNFYSKKLLTKKKAIAQQKALYASESRNEHFSGAGFASWRDDDGHHIILQGNGFFTDLFSKIRNIGTNIIGSFTAPTLSNASSIISKGIREDYPPKVRQVLEQYGNANVIKLNVIREPIKKFIDYALNIISLGRWGEAKRRLNYDKLFHLYMIATLQLTNGDMGYLKIEKNEVINITTDLGTRDQQAEYETVPVPCCLTVFEMMNNTREAVGPAMFKYEAFNNNCQIFLLNILKANDLATGHVSAFINQGVENLLQELPQYVRPFANLTTNIAGLANRIVYGRGEEPLSIDTSAKVNHPTSLSADKIKELIESLQFADETTKDEQYDMINAVLEFLLSDPQYLQAPYDNFEISHAYGVLSESRQSKPYEFVNVIEKVLEDLEPELEGGGLNPDGSWDGSLEEWQKAGNPGCGPGMMNDPLNEGVCIPINQGRQSQSDLDKYSNLASVKTAIQDEDDTQRNLAISMRQEQEARAKDFDSGTSSVPPVPPADQIPNWQTIGNVAESKYTGFAKAGYDESSPNVGNIFYYKDGVAIAQNLKPGQQQLKHTLDFKKIEDQWYKNSLADEKQLPSYVKIKGDYDNALLNSKEYDEQGREKFNPYKHTSLDWLSTVEGKHRRELDPMFEQIYQAQLENQATVNNWSDKELEDYKNKLESDYKKDEERRYGDSEEIYSPEKNFTLTDKKGQQRRVNKVRLRKDGGYDIQYSNGSYEYQPGEDEWDCNEYQKGDNYWDSIACGTKGREKAASANEKLYRDQRDKDWDNLSGWDKFVNGLNVAGRVTQDYIAPIASTVLNFVPGMGAVSTAIDVANDISKELIGDNCRDFNECTDATANEVKARSLYHKTKGDSVAMNYATDENWQRLLGQNDKAHGLVSDLLQYGSRAGKYDATGSGKLKGKGKFKDTFNLYANKFERIYKILEPFYDEDEVARLYDDFYRTYQNVRDQFIVFYADRAHKTELLNNYIKQYYNNITLNFANLPRAAIYEAYGDDLSGITNEEVRAEVHSILKNIDAERDRRAAEEQAVAQANPEAHLQRVLNTEPTSGVAFQDHSNPNNIYLIKSNAELDHSDQVSSTVEGQGQRSSRVMPFTEEEAETYNYLRTVEGFNALSREQKIRATKKMVQLEKAYLEMEAREAENPSLIAITGPDGKFEIAERVSGSGEEVHINPLFKRQLKQVRINPRKYLEAVREIAKGAGYDPSMLYFSDDGNHKLMMLNPDGKKTHFGAVEYGDYLIWKHLEDLGKVQKGYAEQKRRVFSKSHCKIKGDWKKDKYSANQLALSITWADAKCS
jgi:hypothetical protein